jgi:mRNA-degrading endonuclease RelE of RelBE toxin-antitoxin system
VTYQVELLAEVQTALRRLRAADPAGAQLVADTVRGLAVDPRPTGVHVLNVARGLHRVHLSRIDRATGRTLHYRVMYQIQDEYLMVIVITAAALPRPSRRR